MTRGAATRCVPGVFGLALTLALALVLPRAVHGQSSGDAGRLVVGDSRVVLRTSLGDVVIALFPTVAPRHVEHVLRLARLGVYDGTHFPRVEREFVVQLSDATDRRTPLSAEQRAALRPIALEPSPLHHRVGVVSMAHPDEDPNGAVSSFVIIVGEAAHLDGRYTLFGEVERGMDVVDAIANVPVDDRHRPRARVDVTQALVLDSERALQEFPLRSAPTPARAPDDSTAPAPQSRPHDDDRVVLETSMGDVLLALDAAHAPLHVERFLRLVRAHAYDSVEIGRVDPSYFVQVFSVEHRRSPLPPLWPAVRASLPREAAGVHHVPGTVSASDAPPGTIPSSLTFVLADAPQLDGQYTPFARVERGQDVLTAIARLAVDANRRPRARVEITRAYVVGASLEGPARVTLRGPTPLPNSTPASVLALIALSMLLGLALFVAAPRISARTAGALGLLIVLVGYFALLVALAPVARGSRAVGIGLFVGALVVFRLMSRFEGVQPSGDRSPTRRSE